MSAVKLQSESVMAARFSTEEALDLLTVDDDFALQEKLSFMIQEACMIGMNFMWFQEIWLYHLPNMCMMDQIS